MEMQTAEHVANEVLIEEIAHQIVLEAILKTVNFDGLTSFLLKHGYYLTKSSPSVMSSRSAWRGAQETYGREAE